MPEVYGTYELGGGRRGALSDQGGQGPNQPITAEANIYSFYNMPLALCKMQHGEDV
jgi:hypothetical protein